MSRLTAAVLYGLAALFLMASVAAFRFATRSREVPRQKAWTVASATCLLGCAYATAGARRLG